MRLTRRHLSVVMAAVFIVLGLPVGSPIAAAGDDLPCRGDLKKRTYQVTLSYSYHREDPGYRGAPTSSDYEHILVYPRVEVRSKKCKGNKITLFAGTAVVGVPDLGVPRFFGSDDSSKPDQSPPIRPCTWDINTAYSPLHLSFRGSTNRGSVPGWEFHLTSSLNDPEAASSYSRTLEDMWKEQCPPPGGRLWYNGGPIHDRAGDFKVSINGLHEHFRFETEGALEGSPPAFLEGAEDSFLLNAANRPYLVDENVRGARFSASARFVRIKKGN
jgi:hypothetical protein